MASQLFLYNAGTTLLGCGFDGISGLLATTGSSFVKVNTATGACTGVAAISGDNRGITSIATSSTASYVFVGSNKIYEYLDNNGTFSNTINVASGDTIMALTGKLVNGEYRCYYYPATNAGVLKYLVYGNSTIHTVSSSGTSLALSGLTEMGGYFYGCGSNDHTIYKIDYTTGIATVVLVADSSITWRYITNDGTNLYACAQGVGAYIINPTTLAMSLISVGASAHSWHGIAYLNSTLYMTALDGYIIGISNPATGTYMTEPTASLASGTYTTNQTITLSADNGASIYYILDGSNPTPSTAILYTSPFTINYFRTLTIRAYINNNKSSIISYSYIWNIPNLLSSELIANTPSRLFGYIKYGNNLIGRTDSDIGMLDITNGNYTIKATLTYTDTNEYFNTVIIGDYLYTGAGGILYKYLISGSSWVLSNSWSCALNRMFTDGTYLYGCSYNNGNTLIYKISTDNGTTTSLGTITWNLVRTVYSNGYFYSTDIDGMLLKWSLSNFTAIIQWYSADNLEIEILNISGVYIYVSYSSCIFQFNTNNMSMIKVSNSCLTVATGMIGNLIYFITKPTASTYSLNVLNLAYVNINSYAALGGVWKKISNMYVSQAGVWKTVSKLYKAESGSYVEKI